MLNTRGCRSEIKINTNEYRKSAFVDLSRCYYYEEFIHGILKTNKKNHKTDILEMLEIQIIYILSNYIDLFFFTDNQFSNGRSLYPRLFALLKHCSKYKKERKKSCKDLQFTFRNIDDVLSFNNRHVIECLLLIYHITLQLEGHS